MSLLSRFSVASAPVWAVLALVGMTAALMGCKTQPATASPGAIQRLAALSYPQGAQVGPAPDVVVRQDGGTIILYNRTAHALPSMQLWLNRQYVRVIGPIRVGDNPSMSLTRFINRHREPFPVGTVLSPDATGPVLLAELYNPKTHTRYKLTVQPPADLVPPGGGSPGRRRRRR